MPNTARAHVFDALDQMRAERHAVVGDDRDGLRLLHRGERVVTLPDARRYRVAQIPLAVLFTVVLAREALALPRPRGKHARQLALDVDAGLLSVAEPREIRVGIVDVGFSGEHVVVRVAGGDDRFGHVDVSVSAGLVVAETVRRAGYLIEAGIEDRLRRGALARGKRRQREKRLDGRARRIRAAQRPVEERLVRGVVEQLPVGGIDAIDKQVGIESRLGDKREHVAGGGLDRDERATAVAERRFRGLLQAYVQRELQVVPGNGRRTRKRADRTAAGVDFDLLHARGAVQLALVRELDADFADVIGAFVIGRLFPVFDALDVAIVDAADVADDVRGHFAERIMAEQSRLDFDPGEAVAVNREARDFLVGEPRAQREALEVLRLLEQALEALAVARLNLDDLGELVDGFIEVLHPRRGDLQRISRIALRKHDAIAIRDDATVGNDGHDRDAVAFGERLIRSVLDQLQVNEAAEQARECHHDQRAGESHPAAEVKHLAPGIPELGPSQRSGAIALFEEAAHAASLGYRSAADRRGLCGHCSTIVTIGHSSAPASGPTI